MSDGPRTGPEPWARCLAGMHRTVFIAYSDFLNLTGGRAKAADGSAQDTEAQQGAFYAETLLSMRKAMEAV